MLSKQASGAAKDPAHKPDEKVSSEEEYTQSVQFDKVDANDTHSLVIGGDLPKDAGLTVSGTVSGDFADALTGSTYSITELEVLENIPSQPPIPESTEETP